MRRKGHFLFGYIFVMFYFEDFFLVMLVVGLVILQFMASSRSLFRQIIAL
jgi:hypothetical protein